MEKYKKVLDILNQLAILYLTNPNEYYDDGGSDLHEELLTEFMKLNPQRWKVYQEHKKRESGEVILVPYKTLNPSNKVTERRR